MQPYTLVRSRRKTLSISFDREGQLIVRCPLRLPLRDVQAFLLSHSDWIERHNSLVQERLVAQTAFDFSDGLLLPYKGLNLPIHTAASSFISDQGVFLPLPFINRKDAYLCLLREQAYPYLIDRVNFFSPQMGCQPAQVRITAARTRWGSCNTKGNICFAERLLCLSPAQIDYVVVHELAHLLQHNHSALFYAEIACILPDYRVLQAQIKQIRLPV